MRVAALIPAAGQGKRMGAEKPKAFLPLGDRPILAHTLQKFEDCPQVDEVLPLLPPGEGMDWAGETVRRFGLKKVSRILPGGQERQDSVYRGLQALRGKADWVIIHDGVRPFVPPELIQQVLSETRRWKAVVVALPASETIKEGSPENEVVRTVDRRRLWMIQTPQSFEYPLILRAHEEARREGFLGTDDASLVERLGIPVKILRGSRFNFKITTPEDLVLAEALLKHWKGKC
ncbi:MAG TPA: 2-C-methyl-D-erythritol 4-phosphate cytidylyltransferase [Thermodesulfobacteriota bacterium]